MAVSCVRWSPTERQPHANPVVGNAWRGGPSEGMSALPGSVQRERGATEERRNEEPEVGGGSGSGSGVGRIAGAGAGGGEERAAETGAGTIGSGARTME